MVGTGVCECLVEIAMSNSNGTQSFGNLRTHYDGPGEHLKCVSKANQILENIYYKNENTGVTFEVYVTRIKESYKILKYHGEIYNDSQKLQ